MDIGLIFLLLIVFQFKHFIADYPLQGSYMLGKFKGGTDWIMPLVAHCGVHFVFTLGIVLCVNPSLWWLAGVDFGIHFIMDRIKASPNLLGRFKALSAQEFKGALRHLEWIHEKNFELRSAAQQAQKRIKGNTYFWWALGLDQMVHHLTDLLIVFILVV